MGKTATLNIRVNPDVKENAESVLAQLGIPMATAIDMYLKQISLVGGIPFSIVLPKAANSVNADMMSATQIHQKLEKGLDTFPERFRIMDSEPEKRMELRRMLVDNYSVFYTIRDERVIVTDVLYTASDIEARLRGAL